MCKPCVKFAFQDASRGNYKFCPFCHNPGARAMMEWLGAKGFVRAMEEELRPKVEFEVEKRNEKREIHTADMTAFKDRARILFLKVSSRLNMKCPRCSLVFDDYDGCNALTCASPSCRASFCAICLEDCGHDAHGHVSREHGNLFDKEMFYRCKSRREKRVVAEFMLEIDNEPLEVKELVMINYEKSFPDQTPINRIHSGNVRRFLAVAKDSLAQALRDDRLSENGARLPSPRK
jgi:hypothetical protein